MLLLWNELFDEALDVSFMAVPLEKRPQNNHDKIYITYGTLHILQMNIG